MIENISYLRARARFALKQNVVELCGVVYILYLMIRIYIPTRGRGKKK